MKKRYLDDGRRPDLLSAEINTGLNKKYERGGLLVGPCNAKPILPAAYIRFQCCYFWVSPFLIVQVL